jgi:WD40 repeat protein
MPGAAASLIPVAEFGKTKRSGGHTAPVRCLKAYNRRYLLSGGLDGKITMWSLASLFDDPSTVTPANNIVMSFLGHTDGVRELDIIYSANYFGEGRGRDLLISVSNDKTVRLWNLQDGGCLRVIEGHKNFITCLHIINSTQFLTFVLPFEPDSAQFLLWLALVRAAIICFEFGTQKGRR